MKDLDRELTEVLKYLPGWKLDQAYRDHIWCSAITDGTGRGIHFNTVRMKGRVYLSGRFNDNCRPDHHEHISIVRNRPPQAIAADIQRRFLPWYLEAYSAEETRAKETGGLERRTKIKQELSAMLDDSVVNMSVTYDGEHVNLGFRAVRIEVAKAVLKAYNRAAKSAQEKTP